MAVACRLISGYGNGAGFLVTHDGLVATCAHGVYEGQTLRAELTDETLHDARVVARWPERDLALLKIDGIAGRAHARLGDPKTYAPGTRFFVVGFDQLPESSMTPVYLPDIKRSGRISGPLALEVGFAGMLRVRSQGQDPGFDVALTTRTAQVRPGYSGAMVCAPDGVVVGVHVAALELGGFGQEISAVELTALVARHGHVPPRAPATPVGPEGTGERWNRVLYALQCMELDRREVDRGDQAYRDDLATLGDAPSDDPEVRLAQCYAHRDLEEWTPAIARGQEAVALGGVGAAWTLRDLAPHGDGAEIARFLETRIEAMPDLLRRVLLRTAHLGLLNDRREFEHAAVWVGAAERDAYEHPDSAVLRLEGARTFHALGQFDQADAWLRRAAWARDADRLRPSEIVPIAADSPEPRTRWYGLRKALTAIESGQSGAEILPVLERMAGAYGAAEAATLFASLRRIFDAPERPDAPSERDPAAAAPSP